MKKLMILLTLNFFGYKKPLKNQIMKTIKLLLIALLFLSTCSKDDETIQDPKPDPEPENLEQVFRDKLEGVWESSYMLRSDGKLLRQLLLFL